jgi:hypothetical protein
MVGFCCPLGETFVKLSALLSRRKLVPAAADLVRLVADGLGGGNLGCR